jgi:galactose mutarotase-like enzyme
MASTTLKSKGGVEVTILKRGAIIQSLKVPGRDGKVADVVLGFDDEEPYKVRAAAALTAGGKADLNESKCPVLVSMQ